ncbi:RNA polymerase sigma factor [Aliidiomarina sp. B3213]|uniref:RNA polymerase sigma factor n=1 Tax=Aliidiomarina sp. B3213 TaxID=2249757 RepID=UPI0014039DE9|nr:sigma-70 family RNA polymerase sigma factor [Aliidiomarina sp. B3213]
MPTSNIKQRISKLAGEYGSLVYQCAYKILGDRHQAEDIAQEVFLKLFKKSCAQMDEVQHWGAYLKTMATSASCDFLRKRYHQQEVSEQAEVLPFVQPNNDQLSGPERSVENQIQLDLLREALARLKPQEAEVFVLRNIEQLSYQEIADQLAINSGHVGAILHRTKDKLAVIFSETNSEEAVHVSN